MGAEASAKFMPWCDACQGDSGVEFCYACERGPAWFTNACAHYGVDPWTPFAEAVFYTSQFYTYDIGRAQRVLTASGQAVCDAIGAAWLLGGKPAVLQYLRGLALPGVDASGYCVEFAPSGMHERRARR